MDFESFDLENLNTNPSVELSYDSKKKIKNLLIDLINEGNKLIKETEKKCPPAKKPRVLVKNVRRVPNGLTINHKKSPTKPEEIKPQINFLCGICKTRFKTINLLSEHSKICRSIKIDSIIDEEPKTTTTTLSKQFSFNCGVCKTDFNSLELLSEHSEGCKVKSVEDENLFEDDFNDMDDYDDDQEIQPIETIDIPSENLEEFLEENTKNKPTENVKLFKFKNGKYSCSVCSRLFDNLNAGMFHTAKHFSKCKFIKKGERVLINKKEEVKKIEPKLIKMIYKCPSCVKTFSTHANLTEHLLIHKEEEAAKTLLTHTNFIRNSLKDKPAPKTFIKHSNLTKNSFEIIPDKKMQRYCKFCDKNYSNLKVFNHHLNTVHKTIEKFKCKFCEKITFTMDSLDAHMLLAHPNVRAKFHCEKCDHAPFREEKTLIQHLAKKHSTPKIKPKQTKICEICNKSFCDFHSKVRHIAMVHENRIIRVCEICGKSFKGEHLSIHYRTHTNERNFQCDQCDSKFRHSQDLVIHKRLHTGERPYECLICNQRFIASTNLTKHLKSRHVVTTGIPVE